MPSATAEVPAVALSFANNFWGKDDAGVIPLLERMHAAKLTCDELKSFYSARASIEDDYSRKLLNLCRKALGSQETGTLRHSLDTMRGEVEQMAKQHQTIAAQMKTELEEPLAAFAGGMKERRKIVQNTVEKLLKTKTQQTQHVNKARDKYEQECLKIKGYLAQGHMVMGQEERRNKAKLEKTQISLATSNTEYEHAVKALEETTVRWNREWKAAADKFQDLEEERLDFTKSSLWTFANIASTVCVSDDASCEKIRLSLEKMDVEKDIIIFISERGTGQEIPDPPKYINFCRGDVNDSQSEVSEDDNYSVAQFPRSINPAFRSSSPQPSTFESHHDPDSALALNLAHRDKPQSNSREPTVTPQKPSQQMRPFNGREQPAEIRPFNERTQSAETRSYSERGQSSEMRPSMELRSSTDKRSPMEMRQPMEIRQSMESRSPLEMRQPIDQRFPIEMRLPMEIRAPPEMRQSLEMRQPQEFRAPPEMRQSLEMRQPKEIRAPPEMRQSLEARAPTELRQPKEIKAPPEMRQSLEMRQPKEIRAAPEMRQSLEMRSPIEMRQPMESRAPPEMRQSMERRAPPEMRPSMDRRPTMEEHYQRQQPGGQLTYDANQHGHVATVPHDPYPMDGMTMLCRTGPPGPPSDRSSQPASARPSSRDSRSEYSNPTSFSSMEPPSGKTSPTKQDPAPAPSPEKRMLKKKSGFFQNHSPFRRKSVKDLQASSPQQSRNSWQASSAQSVQSNGSPARRQQMFNKEPSNLLTDRGNSPDPIDANASLALGVGQNVFPVSNPDTQKRSDTAEEEVEETDPIALALAELKGVTLGKQSSIRMSADHYHGIATPAPGSESSSSLSRPVPAPASRDMAAVSRGTPPPSYHQQTQVSRLGVPPPAVTSKAMKDATKKVNNQTRSIFGDSGRRGSGGFNTSTSSRPTTKGSDRGSGIYSTSPSSRPATKGSDMPRAAAAGFSASTSSRPATRGSDIPRAASPAPPRAASPQPSVAPSSRRMDFRSASPNPYTGHQQAPSQANTPQKQGPDQGMYRQASPNEAFRAASPASFRDYNRPQSSYSSGGDDMAVQLAPISDDPYGSVRSQGSRPASRAMGLYDGGDSRQRSKSVADPSRLYTGDGRPILHYAKALYMYQAAIPEELGFAKGDYLAVLRHQDDGWWEAEVHGGNGRIGLVPSNYLQPC